MEKKNMENVRKSSQQYGALDKTELQRGMEKPPDDVISMADSTVTIEEIEGELLKIDQIRDILVRRESELRYMMDDIQLCKEITRLKQELQRFVTIPDIDKSTEDREKEEELLKQINKLVETRDFLVDDVEFERLRELEEDKEMAAFLKSKFPKGLAEKAASSKEPSLPGLSPLNAVKIRRLEEFSYRFQQVQPSPTVTTPHSAFALSPSNRDR